MNKRLFAAASLVFLSFAVRPSLSGQTVVAVISKPNLRPTAVAVYEGGNKVLIGDKTSGSLLVYDDRTLEQLATIPLGITQFSTIVVDEKYGKAYCVGEKPDWTNETIAVVDAVRNKFLRYIELPFQRTFTRVAYDPGLHRIFAMSVGGCLMIDVAADGVTPIAGIKSNPNRDMEVNPVTHDVYISNTQYAVLDILNGLTLQRTKIANMYGLGVGVNWLENKAYVLYYVRRGSSPGDKCEFCVYDRDTNAKKRLVTDNDSTKLAFNPTSNRMYSSSEINSVTTIVDGRTDAFFNLPMKSGTGKPAVRRATNHVYYAADDYIAVLEDGTQFVEILPVENPHPNWLQINEIAVNQKSGRVYVINDGLKLNQVTVIQDGEPLSRPPVYVGSRGFAFHALQVFDPGAKTFLDPDFMIEEPPFDLEYHAAAFSPGGGRFFIPIPGMGFQVNTIAEYAGFSHDNLIRKMNTGGRGAMTPVVSPDSRTIYVSNSESDDVSVIDRDSSRLIKRIPVGSSPLGMDITEDGKTLLVANKGEGTVSVIDAVKRSELGRIQVGGAPWGLAIHPGGRWAYVANNRTGTVSVLDVKRRSILATVPVGAGPRWLACSPDGRRVWVANAGGYSLTLIDTRTNEVEKTISVSASPEGICLLPDGSEAYVATGGVLTAVKTADLSMTTYRPKQCAPLVSATVADPTSRFAGCVSSGGVAVGGVAVEAFRAGISRGRSRTDGRGDYVLHNLPAGRHVLKFAKTGYQTQNRSLVVQTGQTRIFNVNLKKS